MGNAARLGRLINIANYADTSGNPTAAKVYRAAKIIFSQPGIEGYMLGGFMYANQEQWHHAHGVVKALREELPKRPGFPCVLLLCGNKEKESLEILREGTKDLPGRIEIYGADKVYETQFLASRMKARPKARKAGSNSARCARPSILTFIKPGSIRFESGTNRAVS